MFGRQLCDDSQDGVTANAPGWAIGQLHSLMGTPKQHREAFERDFSEATTVEDMRHLRSLGFGGGRVSFGLILLVTQIAKPMPAGLFFIATLAGLLVFV